VPPGGGSGGTGSSCPFHSRQSDGPGGGGGVAPGRRLRVYRSAGDRWAFHVATAAAVAPLVWPHPIGMSLLMQCQRIRYIQFHISRSYPLSTNPAMIAHRNGAHRMVAPVLGCAPRLISGPAKRAVMGAAPPRAAGVLPHGRLLAPYGRTSPSGRRRCLCPSRVVSVLSRKGLGRNEVPKPQPP